MLGLIRLFLGSLEGPQWELRHVLTRQNAALLAGIEKEIEGVTLLSMRQSAPQSPLNP